MVEFPQAIHLMHDIFTYMLQCHKDLTHEKITYVIDCDNCVTGFCGSACMVG